MGLYEILYGLILAGVFTTLLFFGFRNTGPWGNIWIIGLVMLAFILASIVWIDPEGGPQWEGVNIIPPIVVGVILILLIVSVTPAVSQTSNRSVPEEDGHIDPDKKAKPYELAKLSIFFWLLLLLLVTAIMYGAYS